MSLRYALSPSGGVAYHLIARRRSRTLWRPFRALVRDWLSVWLSDALKTNSGSGELIVFGPSAGWTLPLEDFASFSSLTFVEPDPVARFLLRRRLRAAGVHAPKIKFISRTDLLPWFCPDGSAIALIEFLHEHTKALILFSNVLGQLPLHMSRAQKSRARKAQTAFSEALRGRTWASYHDLFSGSALGAGGLKQGIASDLEAAARDVFTSGDVIDHEMAWLSEGQTTQVGLWPITEKSVHVIGFVHNLSATSKGISGEESSSVNRRQDKASR